MEKFTLKLSDGQYYVKVDCEKHKDMIHLYFPYNKNLLEEVKTRFEGRKWLGFDGPKCWAIPITQRNIFQLNTLQKGNNPYIRWDKKKDYTNDILEYWKQRRKPKNVDLYKHQVSMINQALNVGWYIWAADPGTGKTLSAIIFMELSGIKDWIWIGPKSPLVEVRNQFSYWQSYIIPSFHTYDSLKQLVTKWPTGKPAPQGIMFDEFSRCKTPATQRSVAAKGLADACREDHSNNCFVGGLSGTPAPKSPADWYWLCEIIAPGFIKEGNIHLFKQRLGIFQQRETVTGAGTYNHLITWKDDSNKCDICGQLSNHVNHQDDVIARMTGGQTDELHTFKPGRNEVANLSKRLSGLVGVWLKENCLDLPAKRFEIITVKPTRALLNAAKLITQTTTRAADALIKLRTLSDGFQYKDTVKGQETCSLCKGTKEILEWFVDDIQLTDEEVQKKEKYIYGVDDFGETIVVSKEVIEPIQKSILCPKCCGEGLTDIIEREIVEVECPKDQVLIDFLEQSDEVGRLNVFAGFTGSIERVSRISRQQGWNVIRVDGRGWFGFDIKGNNLGLKAEELLKHYQDKNSDFGPLVFIGQPGAGGMGLNLSVSPITFFFSNDFNAESRLQAIERGHRLGMDIVRGGRIIDVIHLPSDQYVLDNLNKKQNLQRLSMVGLKECMEKSNVEEEV